MGGRLTSHALPRGSVSGFGATAFSLAIEADFMTDTTLLRGLFASLALSLLAGCQCGKTVDPSCDPATCNGCCHGNTCVQLAHETELSCGLHTTCGACATGELCTSGACIAGSTGGGGGGDVDAGGGTGGGVTGGGTGGGVTGGGTGGGTTGGGSGGGTTGGGAGGGTVTSYDFDGGWKVPNPGSNPALVGDGGTTVVIGAGAPAGAASDFGGPTTGGAITILYPPDGVMLPPNTNTLEFHFVPAAGQSLFRFTFKAPTTTLELYTGCAPLNGGCVFTPDATFWSSLVAYARGTQPVSYSISGVSASTPGAVGTSATQSIAFTEQVMKGGLYYWNTTGIVQRYDYGFPNAQPQNYLTTVDVGAFACVGCHVISRLGNRIAVGKDIPAPAPYSLLNVVTKQPVVSTSGALTGSANFFNFSPDEQHLLSSNGVNINWRELVHGSEVLAVAGATMPDWSPDGLHMVYAKPQSKPFFPAPGVDSASIGVSHFNGTGWDTPTTLVPFSGQNNYYPAYSPDGNWIIFNRSPQNLNSFSNASPDPDAGTLPDGELWAVSAAGGTPVRLGQASDPGACSWPKWAPTMQNYYGGQVMWLTFSSARQYGLRLAPGQQTQLWMVAFDPAKISQGQDPSFPAFWLPFQSLSSGNHIAQWSLEVPRATCSGSGQSTCAAGEHCLAGKCSPG
jgi:TolB protein